MNSSGPRARGRHPDHREQAKIKPLRSNAGTPTRAVAPRAGSPPWRASRSLESWPVVALSPSTGTGQSLASAFGRP